MACALGIHRAEHSSDVDATPGTCFEAITDYESFPAWQQAVERIEVLDRDERGLGRRVRVEVDAKAKRIGYTLDYSYEPPARVRWEFVEGDGVELIEGEFVFEALDGGDRTRATYRLGIDPGVAVPGFLARRLSGGVMRRSLEDLRREAERREGGR